MCDFGTMLFGGLRAIGSLIGGSAGSKSHSMGARLAQSNADMLTTQAEIARTNADIAVTRGNYDEFLQRRKVEHVLAAEKVAYAGGNVDPTYGSPLLVQGFSAAQGETDAQIIRARRDSEVADALTGAANLTSQATAQTFRAAAERTAAHTSMLGGLIGAGTAFLSAGSKWTSLSGGGGGTDFLGGLKLGNPFLSTDS